MSRRRSETPEQWEMRLIREQAEQRDARRNQPITRGEILDAIDATMLTRVGAEVGLLRALREAFE